MHELISPIEGNSVFRDTDCALIVRSIPHTSVLLPCLVASQPCDARKKLERKTSVPALFESDGNGPVREIKKFGIQDPEVGYSPTTGSTMSDLKCRVH